MGLGFVFFCSSRQKGVESTGSGIVKIDLESIDSRSSSLHDSFSCKMYERKKSILEKEFSRFLMSLPERNTVFTRSPKDVIRLFGNIILEKR